MSVPVIIAKGGATVIYGIINKAPEVSSNRWFAQRYNTNNAWNFNGNNRNLNNNNVNNSNQVVALSIWLKLAFAS